MPKKTSKITTPLCPTCLSNKDKICEKCAKLYKDQLINKIDIRVMRGIYEVVEKLENIEAKVHKTITCGEVFLILCDEQSKPQLIGNCGLVAKEISHKIKHNISIIAIPSQQTNENLSTFFKQIFGEQVIKVEILPQNINVTMNEDLQSKYFVKNEYLFKEVERALKLAGIKKKMVFLKTNTL